MPNRFSSGKFAIAQCDRCNFRFKLKELKTEIIKTKNYNLLVCDACWDPDHPQLQLGMYPVNDPQAVREPRPDISYYSQTEGYVTGSRQTQWGWNPVGGARGIDAGFTPNNLAFTIAIGSVTVVTS